jgi:hypothetical protein
MGASDPEVGGTIEWLKALQAVQQHRGPERAAAPVGCRVEAARRLDAYVPQALTPPYFDTIAPEHEERPTGERAIETPLHSLIRWTATCPSRFPGGCWSSAPGSSGWRWRPPVRRSAPSSTWSMKPDGLMRGADRGRVNVLEKHDAKRSDSAMSSTKTVGPKAAKAAGIGVGRNAPKGPRLPDRAHLFAVGDVGRTGLLFDEATHRTVGGGIVGTHAGDPIGEACLAVERGCEPTDIETTRPHPTPGESIGMMAEGFERVRTDRPPQRRT